MNILVTGYKGFIGQNFVSALAHHNIKLYEWGEPLPDFNNVELVIHLGAITNTLERDIHKVMLQNYEFSCWLFEECGKRNIKLQYASSASVYGASKTFRETDMPQPQSVYAWSKFLFEQYVAKNLYKYPNLVAQGFRYFNVYGPHEQHKGDQASPYHKFLSQAIHNREIVLFLNSENYLRDFIPVEQVIEIQTKFFSKQISGVWNVGTGNPRSFRSIAEQIASRTGAAIKYIPMPDSLKTQYQSYTCANLELLRSVLE